jgi:hypothetical protein
VGISAGKKVKELSAKSYCRVRLRLWNGSVVYLKSPFIGAFSQGVEKSQSLWGRSFGEHPMEGHGKTILFVSRHANKAEWNWK